MYHCRKNEQVCRPAMDRANQPAELNFRHNKIDTLKSKFFSALIIEKQENSRHDLDNKEK